MANKEEKFTFEALPEGLDELKALPEAALDSPFRTTALVVAALCNFEKSENATFEMLDFLKGPDNVSPFEKQFIKERLAGKYYKTFSYFAGATPENGYVPTKPYTITVTETPYSYPQENYATMYVTSGGADSPRSIRLRKKPSTGQWFLVEIQCLSDIRVPVEEDPWA
ncbi:MAG: hypothetical protein IJF18_06810 [Oscillospiraceae bacterium]|nr:hypothetical protein [Oscillospiraceae bacterium]